MKKLTIKTFLLLFILSLAVILSAYGCIWIFLPYADKNHARSVLAADTQTLAGRLRETSRQDSEQLFSDFIQKTGADVCLLDGSGVRISLFTFEKTGGMIPEGERHPFRFSDSTDDYILITHYNPARSDEIVVAIRKTIPYVAAILILLSGMSAFLFSHYTTRPILRISKIADRLANLDFSWYCPDIRDDEIGALSKSINELSDKLHSALDEIYGRNAVLENEIALEKERERRRMLFFSSVSHELKTPLATVIGQLEGMQANIGVYRDRDKYLARSSEILQSLNSFIREILLVSHIDMEAQATSKTVCLSDILDSLTDDHEEYAALSSITVCRRIDRDVFVRGDEAFLKKALGNVIGNAVAHSPENARVTVVLSRGAAVSGHTALPPAAHMARLTVTNSPAHIDDTHLPHVFEAFYRAQSSSAGVNGYGSGLGLYITKMILDNFHIPCALENTADGVQFTADFGTMPLHTKITQTPDKLHINCGNMVSKESTEG